MTVKPKKIDFEQALKELNTVVEQLEQGDLSLEKSLQMFERGVTLTRQCQTALQEAEQKVKILVEQNAQSELNDYE